jgi:uncharacterized protein YbbC (DUF1343 family)
MFSKLSQLLLICFLTTMLTKAKTQDTRGKGRYSAGSTDVVEILTGAENMAQYMPLLTGKKVAVFANHTSVVGKVHLVDTLVKRGVDIRLIFGPEHGFRGNADAGEKIDTYIDSTTKIKVISLYGSKKKPTKEDLKDIDVMLFDIQDVGVRFYTYISSLQYYLEAAIENSKHLIILDRPNPNGHYIDGPVLKTPFRSFIGMQQIPVVYGMTIGEYALMLVGEEWYDPNSNKWGNSGEEFQITVVNCLGYSHKSFYELPVKPSPNLPDMTSVYLYPSICFFEGTVLSEGRGTPTPFQVFGHPSLPSNLYAFTPVSRDGAKDPKLKNQRCYGWNLSGTPEQTRTLVGEKLQLKWMLEAYRLFPDKKSFFLPSKNGKPEDYFFNKLAGNSELMQQIIDVKSEESIRYSWQKDIDAFKKIRKKYLLYKDFE